MTETKKKVLIVDDDKLLAESLEHIFTDAGYEAKVMLTGERVNDVVATWRPDVILLDIMLPAKSGVDITRELCALHQGICDRIVIMTTLEDSEHLAKALELGVTNYVQKNTSTPQYVAEIAMRIMNR